MRQTSILLIRTIAMAFGQSLPCTFSMFSKVVALPILLIKFLSKNPWPFIQDYLIRNIVNDGFKWNFGKRIFSRSLFLILYLFMLVVQSMKPFLLGFLLIIGHDFLVKFVPNLINLGFKTTLLHLLSLPFLFKPNYWLYLLLWFSMFRFDDVTLTYPIA